MPEIIVRDATDADLPAVAAIYAHHVLTGLASFEEAAPTVEEMARRRQSVLALGAPYLVAELGGRLVGFAYANSHRPRPAYRHTLEDSVYVAPDSLGRGVGKALLVALVARCEQGPFRQMVAVIGDSANAGSVALHAACGFEMVGNLKAVGFKFGRWVDTVLMQRPLGDGGATLPPAKG